MRSTLRFPPRALLVGLVGLAALWSTEVGSMERHTESLEQVIKGTRLAVVASASHVSTRREGTAWKVLEFRADVVRTIFGGPAPAVLRCTYEEGQPHHRGQTTVSPRVTGSGIEFDIQAEDRMVVLIEHAPTDENDCRALRIEPLSNEQLVKDLRTSTS
jgi:hypothetical protein